MLKDKEKEFPNRSWLEKNGDEGVLKKKMLREWGWQKVLIPAPSSCAMDRLCLLGRKLIMQLNTFICVLISLSFSKYTHSMEKYKTTSVCLHPLWWVLKQRKNTENLETSPRVWVPCVPDAQSAETNLKFSRRNGRKPVQSTGENEFPTQTWVLKPTGCEWEAILNFC